MYRRTVRLALALFPVLLALPSARADEVWVDSVNGNDANGGTGPLDAWATITHALTQLGPVPGASVDIVHVLRGEYSVSTGESFPLVLRDRVRLVGEEGPGSTRLRGKLVVGLGTAPTGPETGAEGLAFVAVDGALTMETDGPVRRATFRDLVLEACPTGVTVTTVGAASAGSTFVLEDSVLRDCNTPMWIRSEDASRLAVALRGVRIEGVFYNHLGAWAFDGGELDFLFERSSLRSEAFLTYGLRIQGSSGTARATFLDSAVTSFCLSSRGIHLEAEARIERCTVTGHDYGVSQVGTLRTVLHDSIVYDNYRDFWAPPGAPVDVRNCDLDDALYTGQNGNFSAPPMFADPQGGDYDLQLGSPCIDRLPASGALDLRGRPRDVDGDLDTIAARDVGAIEMRTLDGPEHAAPGEQVALGMHGPAGALAWLRVSREAPLAAPIATPFGALALRPGTMLPIALVRTSGGYREAVQFAAPTSPALVGTTIGYQALVRVPGAPAGAVYSNALGLTLDG